ncbi:MAG: hypothetical protein J2O38_07280 [Acidimicrobiales bacterium]|nr:hypothetical protein [Acidimicrobiales bacterium]
MFTRARHAVGAAVIAFGIALSCAFGAGAATAGATVTAKAGSSQAFCKAYKNLASYKGSTKTIGGFRSSLHHLRSLVQQTEKVAPPTVKAHLTAFLKDEAQLQTVANKSKSYNALKNSAQAQTISGRLSNDGTPVDSYANSHCKG